MHIMKFTEWQGGSGHWYCNDNSESTNSSIASLWWAPARILGIAPVDFVKLLINDYGASVKYFEEKGQLLYWWDSYASAHKFVLYINRMSRKLNRLM